MRESRTLLLQAIGRSNGKMSAEKGKYNRQELRPNQPEKALDPTLKTLGVDWFKITSVQVR